MYSIVPASRDHEEILVHALAWVRQEGDQPYYENLTRHIIFSFLPFLALEHPIYVVPGKVGPHPTVQDIYAPKDPKDVGQTLGRG